MGGGCQDGFAVEIFKVPYCFAPLYLSTLSSLFYRLESTSYQAPRGLSLSDFDLLKLFALAYVDATTPRSTDL